MIWRDQIPGCFGEIDQIFANHPLDEQRAARLLLTVNEQLVPYDDVEKDHQGPLGWEGRKRRAY